MWDEMTAVRIPETLDTVRLPRALLPYVMLMDIDLLDQCLRIRLAGTRLCDEHGAELRGLTIDDIYEPHDAMSVTACGLQMALGGQPSLARKTQIIMGRRHWSYTRLVLPLSTDGSRIDRLMDLIDPSTLICAEPMRAIA